MYVLFLQVITYLSKLGMSQYKDRFLQKMITGKELLRYDEPMLETDLQVRIAEFSTL